MNIKPLLLDSKNSLCVKGKAVHQWLKEKETDHLWQERDSSIDTIIIHAMSAIKTAPTNPFDLEELLALFVTYEVSAHYLILRDGSTFNLVPDNQKAWHAGASKMPSPDNREGVNDFSIGIELAGIEKKPFTSAQYDALTVLLRQLKQRHTIKNIVGHEDISGERAVLLKLREIPKWDPGASFKWSNLI